MQLPATATLQEASALVRAVEAALAAGDAALVIDASSLDSFDTSLIAVLLQAHRLAQAAGRAISVTGAPAQLAQLARLYGVDQLLSLAPASATHATAPVRGA
jgi:phospholipid transport system transporter-binding protein